MRLQILGLFVTTFAIFLGVSCRSSVIAELSKQPDESMFSTTPESKETLPSVSSEESIDTPIPNLTTTTVAPVPPSSPEGWEGWLTYQSAFYNYAISYPQDAKLEMEGVSGFPTEEQPEDMTFQQYLAQLRRTYPEDICVRISYKSGSISIMAAPENGGKYGDCVGFGVGAYDLIEITEKVTVDGVDYLAEGYEIHEQNETSDWVGEFLDFHLDDGTLITFGGGFTGQTSYEDYMSTKEILLQIIQSYNKN